MLIKRLKLDRLLSFGPDSPEIELLPLNVLIGPNGSGKSNLIEAIGLLQAAPLDITLPIRAGGGIGEWVWKGLPDRRYFGLELALEVAGAPIDYWLQVEDNRGSPRIAMEQLALRGEQHSEFARHGDGTTYVYDESVSGERAFALDPGIEPTHSVLAQRQGPHYPLITSVAQASRQIRMPLDWTFGRTNRLRRGSPPDLVGQLTSDLANLPAVLNRLQGDYRVKTLLKEKMALVFDGAEDVHVSLEQGALQIVVQEREWSIPASRLSDGTLRWLYLLSILLDPTPPPLICIEEPELGLHPDLISNLSKLLIEASTRTQLIVTTHSEALVDSFTEMPECVLVCEKENGSTQIKRLDRDVLAEWLKEYRLGPLWSSGEIGGNRW